MYPRFDTRLCPRLCFLRITNLREYRILENPENIDKSHVTEMFSSCFMKEVLRCHPVIILTYFGKVNRNIVYGNKH